MKAFSWEDFGVTADKVLEDIKKYVDVNDISIDAVVPIMRGGNFLGTFLAYKLNVLRILPVQYKYFFAGENKAELRQLLFTPTKDLLPQNPTILVVEGDYCYGTTVKQACLDIQKEIPTARIIVAADLMDYTYRSAVDKYAEAVLYGRYTNHCEELTKEQCAKLGIVDQGIAPWEDAEEEQSVFDLKQFEYKDLESAKKNSERKLEIDLTELLEKWGSKD